MLETTNKHQKKITGSRNFGSLFWELDILSYKIGNVTPSLKTL
jgi:hypothetical protein